MLCYCYDMFHVLPDADTGGRSNLVLNFKIRIEKIISMKSFEEFNDA